MEVYTQLVQNVKLPRMVKCLQKFDRNYIQDIPKEINGQLDRQEFRSLIKPGMSIAIPCGSRGVNNIAVILKTIVDYCKARGAEPFIFPAMGSHGGATPEGQLEIVHALGVTEQTMGCPIKATMEVVPIGKTPEGHTVFIDRYASQADGIIVVGRIKAHTAFHGTFKSGLMKMMTIGLGKQHGAEVCHLTGFKHMARLVPMFGKVILQNAPVLFGVGIVENAYEDTAIIKCLKPEEFETAEPELLKKAKSIMGRLLIDKIDLLIVDQIGKDISGDGADPNVTGAFLTPYASGGLTAQRRVVLDLTESTHGNANGVGLFDATTKRLFQKADNSKAYPNAITSTEIKAVKMPMIMENDKDCISVGLKTCNERDDDGPKIIRIKNTLELSHIYISEVLIPFAQSHPNLELIGDPEPFAFDAQGNLL